MVYTAYHGEVQNGKHVDQVLREYFPDFNYHGIFLDIGAFEPIRISNSFHFEQNAWTVYCIEANTNLIPLLKDHRQNVIHCAVADKSMESVEFTVVTSSDYKWTAGYSALKVSEEYKTIFGWNPEKVEQISVEQRTVDDILDKASVSKVDIVSLDIEGGELNCLKGFNLEKYQPKVLVIENITILSDKAWI